MEKRFSIPFFVGDFMSKAIETKKVDFTKMSIAQKKEYVAKKTEADYERDHEKISIIFRHLEHKGGSLNFRFKKYARDPYVQYQLIDGERYKLPRMVIHHLNNNVHYIEYKNVPKDSSSSPIIQAVESDGQVRTGYQAMTAKVKVPRVECRILDFMDEDISLVPSNVVEVTANII